MNGMYRHLELQWYRIWSSVGKVLFNIYWSHCRKLKCILLSSFLSYWIIYWLMFSVPCCFLFFPFRHLLLAQTVTTQRDHFCFLQSWVISNGVTSHPEQTWLRPRPHVGRLQRRGRPRCSWQGFLLGWKVPAGRQVGPGKKSCPPSTGLQWATAGSAGYTHPAYGCPRVRTLCSSRPYTFPNPEGSKTYI